MAGDDDKREDPQRERVPILGDLRGEVMVFQPISIVDISVGGAQVETAFPLQLDSLHDFRLTLGDRSVVLKGRVAHCHIGDLEEERIGYRTGIEFIDPPEHVRSAIKDFVSTLKAARRVD
jgi:PilZ domain-containing protein